MVIGHWTHLATLVLVGPCRLGPNCFGPLLLQLCLSFGNRQPCLFGRIERPNASLRCPLREPGGIQLMRPWNLLLPVWVTPRGRPLLPLFFLAGGPSAAVPAAVATVMLAEGCIPSLAIART